MENILALNFSIPFLSFLLLQLLGERAGKLALWTATALTLMGTLLFTWIAFSLSLPYLNEVSWFFPGGESILFGIHLDEVAVSLVVVVWIISLMVHVFSLSYMASDARSVRYFSYLGLFTGAMLGLLLADNLLGIYVFWELVGLSSYLLIGFWQTKITAIQAAKKAFLLNRVGDAGFFVAIIVLWALAGNLRLVALPDQLQALPEHEQIWVAVACGGLLLAAMAKSGQWPLSSWLPDAMEGPTPVSALIHAATMVAAGVYLLFRTIAFFPEPLLLATAVVGAGTAVLAGFSALAQNDIKKVLAYSTISQLGFMFLAIGMGNAYFAVFHLVTHAFFKAGLFLVAGYYIHQYHYFHEVDDAQDLRIMGGWLRKKPMVGIAFLCMAASLAGIPFFSGFLSKDLILLGACQTAESQGGLFWFFPAVALFISLQTSVYLLRLIWMVLLRPAPAAYNFVFPKSSVLQVLPVLVLALGSLGLVFSANPFNPATSWWLSWVAPNLGLPSGVMLPFFATLLAVAGGLFSYLVLAKTQFTSLQMVYQQWLKPRSVNFFGLQHFWEKLPGFMLIYAAKISAAFDARWIDTLVNYAGLAVVIAGHVIAWIDKVLIDGLVKSVVWLGGRLGKTMKGFQLGAIQKFYFLAFLAFFVLLFIFAF